MVRATILRWILMLLQSGCFTFYFTHLVPQPTDPLDVQQTCGMLVQAGEIVSHAGDMAHHGNAITNAAYALSVHLRPMLCSSLLLTICISDSLRPA